VTFVGISPKWSKPEWTLQELYAPDIIFLTVCIARVKEAFSFLQRPVPKGFKQVLVVKKIYGFQLSQMTGTS
jgi:hypothetical protein